jgi:hypothetical protein
LSIPLISLAIYVAGIFFILVFFDGSDEDGAMTETETVVISIWPFYLAFWLTTLLWQFFGYLADKFAHEPGR